MQFARRVLVAVAGFGSLGRNIVDTVNQIETCPPEGREVVRDYIGFQEGSRIVVASSSSNAAFLNINQLRHCMPDEGSFLLKAATGTAPVDLPALMEQVFRINARAPHSEMPAVDTMIVLGCDIDEGPKGETQKIQREQFRDLGIRSLFLVGMDHHQPALANKLVAAATYARFRHVADSVGAVCAPYYEKWDHDTATVSGFFAANRLAELDPEDLNGEPASRLLAQLMPGHVSVARLQKVCGIKRVIHSPANIAAKGSAPRRSAKLGFPRELEKRDPPFR